jgi:hypothetical protein
MSAAKQLFKESAPLLRLIDEITPIACKHTYTFVSDQWYREWIESNDFSIKRQNFIIAMELIDKAHLAAVTALMRAKRWADATCLAFEKENFLSWAASSRGLLESAGDTVDGLLNIPTSLALQHQNLARFLSGYDELALLADELERQLDHFVHAKWMRAKRGEQNALKAKDNVEYVGVLETVIPNITPLYHRLCSVCHPSNSSIEFFYEFDPNAGLRLSPAKDRQAIATICHEYPNALQDALMMHCNPALLILYVLHKFPVHPRLKALRKLDWKQSKIGAEIEQLLKRGRLGVDP